MKDIANGIAKDIAVRWLILGWIAGTLTTACGFLIAKAFMG